MQPSVTASATRIAGLEAELAGLRRRIRALELAVACARELATREHNLSNMGWLLSIVFGSAGTLVAVTRSQREDVYADDLHELEMALVKLWIDKKILLRELGGAQRLPALDAGRG